MPQSCKESNPVRAYIRQDSRAYDAHLLKSKPFQIALPEYVQRHTKKHAVHEMKVSRRFIHHSSERGNKIAQQWVPKIRDCYDKGSFLTRRRTLEVQFSEKLRATISLGCHWLRDTFSRARHDREAFEMQGWPFL
jgi:hypothetical protein